MISRRHANRPPTILALPPTGPPPLPPTSPTTSSFFAERWSNAGPRKRWLIYFVTGNPGMIAYYDLFLSHLHFLLTAHPTLAPGNAFEVFGRSLSGFESRGHEPGGGGWPAGAKARKGKKEGGANGKPPFGLKEQIDGVEWALWDHVKGLGEGDGDGERVGRDGKEETNIIVIGHSVGAYMALEVVRRWRESLRKKKAAKTSAQKPVANVGEKRAGELADADVQEKEGGRIVGGVCLFPTVTHIAKSSSGLKLTMLLDMVPNLPLIASLLATLLTFFVPTLILTELLALVLGHPSDAARVTAEFLKSPHGVQQALHMARDELASINHDAWDAEVWGAADPSAVGAPRPKLFFLFGQQDHWVADETRDELIKARGRGRKDAEKWRPLMEVDESGIPHGFCIDPNHSITVAEKVARYIEDVVREESA
ncbi:hypothetical protein SLS57_008832 [Botryosphaeria dothidea]